MRYHVQVEERMRSEPKLRPARYQRAKNVCIGLPMMVERQHQQFKTDHSTGRAHGCHVGEHSDRLICHEGEKSADVGAVCFRPQVEKAVPFDSRRNKAQTGRRCGTDGAVGSNDKMNASASTRRIEAARYLHAPGPDSPAVHSSIRTAVVSTDAS